MEKKIFSLLIVLLTMLTALPSMAQDSPQTPGDKLFAQYREQYSQTAQVYNLDKSGIKDLYSSSVEEAQKAEFCINHTQSAAVLVFSNSDENLVSTAKRDLSMLAKQGYTKDPTEEASYYLVINNKVVEQIGLEQENGTAMLLITKCDFPKNEFEKLNKASE